MPAQARDKRLPTGSGEKILRAIARFHLLTAHQVLRLGIIGVTEKYVYAQLKQLVDNGYLQKSDSEMKRVRDAWVLTEKGRRHLITQGMTIDAKIHQKPPSSLHLAHRIAVNDALISLELLARIEPRLQIIEFVNETKLIRRAVRVTLVRGKSVRYSPDAWAHYAFDGVEGAFALELDRGTEESKVWREKVDAILAYTAGDPSICDTQFGVSCPTTWAVIAVPGGGPRDNIELRARTLLHATAFELKQQGKEKWNALFKIRPATVVTSDPEALRDLFLAPCWVRPGETELVPLIGGRA